LLASSSGLVAPGAVVLSRVEPNFEKVVEPNAGVDETFAPNTRASSPNIAGVEPNAVVDEVFAAPCAVPNRTGMGKSFCVLDKNQNAQSADKRSI
jgi:hypothetical protein